MTQQEALLVLNAIPGMGGVTLKKLLASFGIPGKILLSKQEDLLEQGINPNLAINIVHFPKDKFLEAEYNLLRNKGVEVITILDESYPASLRPIDSAPIVLYMKGKHGVLEAPGMAMVGSRKASSYGLRIAEQFAAEFVKVGLVVVSGGAVGIDTASHKGCLKAQGKTIAVLGCGLNHVYPAENRRLFEEIADQGLLISEFPMNTEPFMYNFPRRNRIISGLSLATVVVEAASKSGSLITADFTLAQNKEVFSVPGNIDSLYSQGTNRLIQEGSKIATSAQEVLEQLGYEINLQLQQEQVQEKVHVSLSVEELKIYELLGRDPLHVDLICSKYEEDIGALMAQMLSLELKGVIKQLPGQFYVRM